MLPNPIRHPPLDQYEIRTKLHNIKNGINFLDRTDRNRCQMNSKLCVKERERKRLTVVAIAAEKDVVADEIGPAAEMGSFGDQHLFDERETVDDDARRGAQRDAEQVAVDFTELRESLEWDFVFGQQMERSDDWPTGRPGWRTFTDDGRRTG